ncbi:DUF5615 family PIN-like protein [bacterium]|nr:DUF5615 family PIN-like protein [bacterium]
MKERIQINPRICHGKPVIRGSEHEGSTDPEIFSLAQSAHAIFLTTNADFFHTIPHLVSDHPGVVVITLHKPNRQNILERLAWFLEHFEPATISGRVFRLRDRSYKVYPGLHTTLMVDLCR